MASVNEILNFKDLKRAAEDFRYFLNWGYPRKASLDLVGNRYQLTSDLRHLLHRGVFSDEDSASRKKKKILLQKVRNKILAIDGYNVIITVEAALSGRPLIIGDDGFIRDISALSGKFRKTEKTEEALQLILDTLKKVKPSQTFFFFDSPISMSGKLSQEVRICLKKENLQGDAKALKVPEKILIGFPGVIATSDTAIIDQSLQVIDLAGLVIKKTIKSANVLHW